MNASSVIAMLQDKLPKNHAQLKTLEDKLNSFDETKINDLVSKIPQLNLKSPTVVFWVGSFIFGALDINRFMIGDKFSLKPKQSKGKCLYTLNFTTKQIWLGALKLAIFLAHAALFVFIISATLDAVTNATTKDLQNAFRLIWANNFIVGILGVVATI